MPSIDIQQLTLDLHTIQQSRACTARVTVSYMHNYDAFVLRPYLHVYIPGVDLGILGGLITQVYCYEESES